MYLFSIVTYPTVVTVVKQWDTPIGHTVTQVWLQVSQKSGLVTMVTKLNP
jgi:hypothetical protein